MSDSLDELSQLLMDTKVAITDLNAKVKLLTATKMDLESRMIAGMSALGMDQVRNDGGTFTVSKSIHPSNVDWELFHEYIIENQALHLLHRRISEKEYSDLVEMGETVPGVTPYERQTLKTRTRK